MKCTDPFVRGGTAYGCGRCRLCRVSMRSIWATRIELEALRYRSNVFVTLTYDDLSLPFVSVDHCVPTLVPDHAKNFLKRLLKSSNAEFGWRQRFFLVGEYGDRTWRPHYHAAFFNFPACVRGATRRSLSGRYLWKQCCPVCELVGDAWNGGETSGDIGLGALDKNRARYLGGYVTKKLTRKEDARLDGRHPEFSRQSRGGRQKGSVGIGAPIVAEMAQSFSKFHDASTTDVMGHLTGEGGRKRPLGRYLRNKFREAVGTTEEVKDHANMAAWVEQMLPLLEAAKKDDAAPTLRAQVIKNSVAASERLRFQEELYRSRKKGGI